MRLWKISCPYCNTLIAEGDGYGDEIPQVWIPYIRCQVCGKLIYTNANEFVCMNTDERAKIKVSLKNCEYIAQSLDRTNNEDYRKFLIEHGFKLYPITESDILKFKNVDFDKYKDVKSSEQATNSLYNVGILIKDEELDSSTGSYKQKILTENQRNYEINRKARRWGSISGLVVGFLSCIILANIDSNGYLPLLGILIGIATAFIVSIGIAKYYEYKNKETNTTSKNTNERHVEKSSETTKNLKQENLASLKQLYEDGIITQEEYKNKALKIIDKNS